VEIVIQNSAHRGGTSGIQMRAVTSSLSVALACAPKNWRL
jgi:hypothetical protein